MRYDINHARRVYRIQRIYRTACGISQIRVKRIYIAIYNNSFGDLRADGATRDHKSPVTFWIFASEYAGLKPEPKVRNKYIIWLAHARYAASGV